MKLQIKNAHLKTKVAFGSRALPLGQRSDADILELAIMARESNSPAMLDYFEQLPSLDELKKAKTDAAIATIPSAPAKDSTTPVKN